MEEKKTQFWLIGELTQHMDKKVLPSNGEILRRLFSTIVFRSLCSGCNRSNEHLAAVRGELFDEKPHAQKNEEIVK
jgi:hypothetical protein